MIYHGVTCPSFQGVATPYTDVDYQRFKALGLNSVLWEIWWSRDLETNELQPQVYNETLLQGLEAQVDLAKSYGLKTALGFRVYLAEWNMWTVPLGAGYVNMNTADASGSLGRDRYLTMLNYMAGRFKDCIIDPWFFPFHQQGDLGQSQASVFYNITQPAFISAIRDAGNSEPIILNPLSQGVASVVPSPYTGVWAAWQTAEFLSPNFKTQSDSNVIYGTNTHDAYHMFANEEYNVLIQQSGLWDYDYATLSKQNQPAVDLNKTVPVGCVELGAMAILPPEPPIEPSRLAWLRATFEIYKANNMSWWYYRYINPGTTEGVLNADGSFNEVGQLIAELFATPATLPYHDSFVDLRNWQTVNGNWTTV